MANRNQPQLTTIDRKRAESLLYPLVAFLRTGGLNKKECMRSFMGALDKALSNKTPRRMEHIGHPTEYADIVTLWTRNKLFLDSGGRPRCLKLRGRASFTDLVELTRSGIEPKAALKVLVRYGNVRRRRDSTYELTRPFFFSTSQKKMAFEPVAFFLSDASATLSRILKRQSNSRGPELFWRKVESAAISDSDAKKFNVFASERSLLFLEELDDWLQAHSRSAKSGESRHRRVGLGMFSICSDREISSPRR